MRTLSTQLRSRLDSLGKAAEQTLSESRQTMTELKAKGVEFIDAAPRQGAHGSRIAFVHPSSGCGLLIEIKEKGRHA